MANVNNENNQRIFQFIASQNVQLTEADKNGDGAISKSELRTFLEETLGFDYAILEGWDGTDKTQNDLFNQFFNSINTNSSTKKIDGTKERNSKALDASEIQNAENRIAVALFLEQYIDENLSDLPDFVGNQSSLKASILEQLEALIEKKLLKSGKAVTNEMISELLDANIDAIKNKAIAKEYASEYIMTAMSDFIENYNYKVNDDKTLKKLIDQYIANLNGEYSAEDVKDGIQNLINDYIKLAEAGEQGSKAVLNDLQKAVLTVKLTELITDQVKSNPLYESNKETYDAAIAQFISKHLAGIQDFQELLKGDSVLKDFAKEQKIIEAKVQASDIFTNKEILENIKNEISADVADKIQKILPGELPSLDKLRNEILNKVQKGEFLNSDGSLNLEKISKFIISELKTIITDLYNGSTSNLSVADLEKIYDSAVDAADAKKDSKAIKTAAKNFCNAIAEKGPSFKAAVEDIFGKDYESTIDKAYAYNVKSMIMDLRRNITNIKEPVTINNKSALVKNSLSSSINNYNGNLDFYVNDKGEIVFVNRTNEAHGAFNAANNFNEVMTAKMKELRGTLEKTYAEELNSIKLNDAQKDALFNVALFTALSDPTVVKSQYEQVTSIEKLVNAVIENYTKLLQKVAKDENAMKFIENYTSNSILAGRTPAPADNYTFGGYTWSDTGATLPNGTISSPGGYWQNGYYYNAGGEYRWEFRGDGKYHQQKLSNKDIGLHNDCNKGIQRYYADDSTYGNDDWVRPSELSLSNVSHTHNGNTIAILEFTNSDTQARGDADALNKAMRLLADDYADAYGSMIDVNRLCELFRQAEQEALNKINTINSQTNAGNSSIYGYGECGDSSLGDPSDNFDTAKTDESGQLINIGNIILQVMFEMERLIALEIMK